MNQSGCKMTSSLTTQLPRYEGQKKKKFQAHLKQGRPPTGKPKQHWVK